MHPKSNQNLYAIVRRGGSLVVVVMLALLGGGVAVAGAAVGLVAVPGRAGCFGRSTVRYHCTNSRKVQFESLALSPDGRELYAEGSLIGATGFSTGVALDVFARDPRTDAIKQLGGSSDCFGNVSGCSLAAGLVATGTTAHALVLSPDGRDVYVAGLTVMAFARDTQTGGLTALQPVVGCASATTTTDTCPAGGITAADSLAISSDGRTVYGLGFSPSPSGSGKYVVIVFSRNSNTGKLTQLTGAAGCLAPGGANGCTPMYTPVRANDLAVSPDGRNVYVTDEGGAGAGEGALLAFRRDQQTGALSPLAGDDACLSFPTAMSTGCRAAEYAQGVKGIVISRDGRYLYTANSIESDEVGAVVNGVVAFRRDPGSGALTPLPGSGCVGVFFLSARCHSAGRGVGGPISIATDTSGQLYATSNRVDPTSNTDTNFHSAGTLALIAPNAKTDALTQSPGTAGCSSDYAPHRQGCAPTPWPIGTPGLAVAPDGDAAYTSGQVLGILIRPIVALSHSPLALTTQHVAIRLRCLPGRGSCTGRLMLRTAHPLHRGKHAKPIELGSTRFTIRPGRSVTLSIRLSAATRARLLASHARRLAALETAIATRGAHTHPAQLATRLSFP